MNWYLQVLKKYAEFGGRSRRKEYWFFVLFSTLISILLISIDSATGTLRSPTGLGLLSGIYSLAVLIPSLAVSVRRLHDTNRTGWWLLLGIVPLLGPIVLLVFFVSDGNPDDNEYGPNPKLTSA
jgi:uncharacterized membrane protein YhaH (DUF805 family)